ncbi:MAG: 50S ribosomal protein L22 [Bacteroidia bacterium]|nr:50S ribosomal protein L22 [Bacteroidia bacterium]MDW8134416.1 50S ribosomal protein L22 [Bacteroidia bacterium]
MGRLTYKEKIAQGIPKPNKGNRKRLAAEALKAKRKAQYYAIYRGSPYPPRKVRLVADGIRGQTVEKAMAFLKLTRRWAAKEILKALRCAINDWEQKTGGKGDLETLRVARIEIDGGPFLKRIQPAPQGRAHLIRKRSSHIRIYLA